MRVAIVHYHLKRGGVTRVVETAIKSLESEGVKCVSIAGEIPDSFEHKPSSCEVEGLRYSNAQENTPTPENLLTEILKAAEQQLGGPPDIWHIHNHSLGKNSSMPGIVNRLANSGAAILLQMHDFAEDGRPENHKLNKLSSLPLYPSGSHVHYACINERDFSHFKSLGIPLSNLHLLSNAISIDQVKDIAQGESAIKRALGCQHLVLYPVRAVRRKNFGEMLLWSAVAPSGTAFATTLGPTNQNFSEQYKTWKDLAAELRLPVHFSIGESSEWSFEEIVAAADSILTTSIAEGFGLAFLEPWLFGKFILGRDLPLITADFKACGIRLDHLYTGIEIPTSWIDMSRLRFTIERELQATYQTYNSRLPITAIDDAIKGVTTSTDHIDFGGLDEDLQTVVIRKACTDEQAREYIASQLSLTQESNPNVITENAQIVRREFGLEQYGKRLSSIYRNIVSEEPSENKSYDGEQLLHSFLKPKNFRLLRT